jgi:hypothetical protein
MPWTILYLCAKCGCKLKSADFQDEEAVMENGSGWCIGCCPEMQERERLAERRATKQAAAEERASQLAAFFAREAEVAEMAVISARAENSIEQAGAEVDAERVTREAAEPGEAAEQAGAAELTEPAAETESAIADLVAPPAAATQDDAELGEGEPSAAVAAEAELAEAEPSLPGATGDSAPADADGCGAAGCPESSAEEVYDFTLQPYEKATSATFDSLQDKPPRVKTHRRVERKRKPVNVEKMLRKKQEEPDRRLISKEAVSAPPPPPSTPTTPRLFTPFTTHRPPYPCNHKPAITLLPPQVLVSTLLPPSCISPEACLFTPVPPCTSAST